MFNVHRCKFISPTELDLLSDRKSTIVYKELFNIIFRISYTYLRLIILFLGTYYYYATVCNNNRTHTRSAISRVNFANRNNDCHVMIKTRFIAIYYLLLHAS